MTALEARSMADEFNDKKLDEFLENVAEQVNAGIRNAARVGKYQYSVEKKMPAKHYRRDQLQEAVEALHYYYEEQGYEVSAYIKNRYLFLCVYWR